MLAHVFQCLRALRDANCTSKVPILKINVKRSISVSFYAFFFPFVSLFTIRISSPPNAAKHRCRNGQIFGVRRVFVRILPNLPKMTPPKKRNKSSLWHVGRHYCAYFQGFAQIFRYFGTAFRYFAQIYKDFARIFTKSKLLSVRLHPLNPRYLHQCCESA